MIKRERAKGFVFGVVLTLMLVSTVGVFASGQVSKNIKVLYNNIKLVVDGKPVSLGKDAAGKQIEPFIYEGTTYLPIRSVGEVVNKKVNWDASTQTIYLGEKPGNVSYLTETIDPYAKNYTDIFRLNDPKKLSMGGKDYNTGYRMGGYSDKYVMFNLDGQYTEITGMLGAANWNYLSNRTLNIYLDGNLYKSIEVDPNELPEAITIPVKGVMQLKLESPYKSVGAETYIGLGDLKIR
jgi:hypothetical protein